MGRRRILVIDDNRDLADSLSELAQIYGHEAEVALDGNAGVAAALAKTYDVIFVDIRLPDIDGIECAHRIRASGIDAHICLMTGYSAPEIPARIAELDDADLLLKPLDPDAVLERIG